MPTLFGGCSDLVEVCSIHNSNLQLNDRTPFGTNNLVHCREVRSVVACLFLLLFLSVLYWRFCCLGIFTPVLLNAILQYLIICWILNLFSDLVLLCFQQKTCYNAMKY